MAFWSRGGVPGPISTYLPGSHRPNVLLCTIVLSWTTLIVFRYANCLPGLRGVCCLLARSKPGWPERCSANPQLTAALQFLLTRNMPVSESLLSTHTSLCGFGFNHYPYKGTWNALSTSEDGYSLFQKAEGESEEPRLRQDCFKHTNFCTCCESLSKPRRNCKGIVTLVLMIQVLK